MTAKTPTIEEWAKLFPAAAKALCEDRAAVMPYENNKLQFPIQKPVRTISRNLVFRLDQKVKRHG